MTDVLKDWVCLNPFEYLDIQPNSQWICCPSWCPTDIRETITGESANGRKVDHLEDLKGNWFSKAATDIRASVLDGSYRHCDHKVCPSLSQLINTGQQPKNFISKEEFQGRYESLEKFNQLPKQILFGYDTSCNLKCPSCRANFIPNDDIDSEDYKIKKFITESIEYDFGESIEILMITGSGDPIYSKIYREYLMNFDEQKYPNMKQIHLITNGNLLNESVWNKMKARKFIKTIEISIDAATKQTYENVTRLQGNWNDLVKNLIFLSRQNTIENITCSMVVSQHNFREMYKFYKLIETIFSDSSASFTVAYRQIVHWFYGAYTPIDITALSVFNSKHRQHGEFLAELNLIKDLPHVNHNFHHLIN